MAEAPPLLAAQALLLAERGRDLIVFNPGARYHCAKEAQWRGMAFLSSF